MRYACVLTSHSLLYTYTYMPMSILTLLSRSRSSLYHCSHTQGLAILCMARASSDMTIEAQCDWGNISMTEWQGGTFKKGSPTPLADA